MIVPVSYGSIKYNWKAIWGAVNMLNDMYTKENYHRQNPNKNLFKGKSP